MDGTLVKTHHACRGGPWRIERVGLAHMARNSAHPNAVPASLCVTLSRHWTGRTPPEAASFAGDFLGDPEHVA